MLRSSNPVLSRKDAFTPAEPARQGYAGPQYQQYQTYQYGQVPGYGQPEPGPGAGPIMAEPQKGRMTLDDVITKTAVLLAVVVLTAAASWFMVPDTVAMPVMIAAALGGVVVAFMVAFRRMLNPTLVFVYAAVEGVFVGLFSKVFESYYPGIVVSAIFASLIAFAVTLAAYKFFGVRIRGLVAKVAVVGTIAFAIAMLANFALSFAGVNLGLRAGVTGPVSMLAIGVSAVAIILCTLNLFLDFQYIEEGINRGAPAKESWRAAMGLMVTLVWMYLELLRLLSYIRR